MIKSDPQMKLVSPSVWVVILNWNGLADTLACLESLAACDVAGAKLQLLVIDNASASNPSEAITTRFPAVEVVCSSRNLGFAGGCNLGIERALQAGADYVLLLNNDTVVAPDFLAQLLAYAQQNPRAGIVAPLICEADRPEYVQSRGGRVLLALGQAYHCDSGQLRSHVSAIPSSVGYASGCCMLIPAHMLRATGGFAELFFAYFEDVDLSLRVQRLGYETVCVPTSVIWHKESASTRRGLSEGTTSALKHYLLMRNRIATVRRNGRWWEQLCFFACALPAIVIFYLGAFAALRRWRKLVWFVRGLLHGLQARLGRPLPEAT